MFGPTEKRLTLTEAAALPGMEAKAVHPQTIWRWATRGVRGVVLETMFVGGQRFTTAEALRRFCESVTDQANSALASPTPKARRRRMTAEAIRRGLARHGI